MESAKIKRVVANTRLEERRRNVRTCFGLACVASILRSRAFEGILVAVFSAHISTTTVTWRRGEFENVVDTRTLRGWRKSQRQHA